MQAVFMLLLCTCCPLPTMSSTSRSTTHAMAIALPIIAAEARLDFQPQRLLISLRSNKLPGISCKAFACTVAPRTSQALIFGLGTV